MDSDRLALDYDPVTWSCSTHSRSVSDDDYRSNCSHRAVRFTSLSRQVRMRICERITRLLVASMLCSLIASCASTAVTIEPSPQAPVCDNESSALVLWSTKWRLDQKDVAARDDAAASGLSRFFADSYCFAHAELRRAIELTPAALPFEVSSSAGPFDTVVTIVVRELGPVVKLFSSVALVEGGTEVMLQVGTRSSRSGNPVREFTIHWRNGGPGVVKGVASLPNDMVSALRSGLQPAAAAH